MIIKDNFKALLRHLQFKEQGSIFTKNFKGSGMFLKVDFKKEKLEYPEIAGLIINERQTCNFSQAENAVVFECVHKLLTKGYKPKHLELEPKWKLGHGASGGRADILVKDQKDKPLLIIECKTFGKEFNKAWDETQEDGGQLFSYAQQISATEFLCLYASEFDSKNNTLLVEQRIISHKDNKKILEQGENLQSFKDASNVKRRYNVWNETYKREYTETGIFEQNIQAYQIGKNKYTLDIDTRPVTDKDKDGKYHRFRTILRQHNIARKETAFEILVNLFLSKIVDEEENKTDLKFYWKGVAYDNYYDFVDRLQQLYQIGMRKFLNDEIMYISNKQIDNAFWTVKNKRNATKKTIQEYFRKLKFFSNNAFSFINVHNERLFNKNAKVLVEIVQMWQNLRLKTKEQNQFLGDMFEFFLDNSIKQSEGQFFTPLPITKFIVMSLPLEDKIKNASEPLRTIDYACGAGHFLTEYAHQIKPLIKKYKETEVAKYYENIVGIEKEDRLAKVAKVSAYMYGQDQINILEEDALSEIQQIKPASFDILVANPPFAVEGFLLNLKDKDKEKYELIKTTDLNSNTNNIQCFFIERAKQIMAPDGNVGIIVPSSILSNSDATHIRTREIILKYFDIVSIVELGSGTFGKTGTNTVVLFLKRKSLKPEPAEHYRNRVDDYFESKLADVLQGKAEDKELQEYQDLGLIRKYCEQTEIPFAEYIKLFGVTKDTIYKIDKLFETDIFKDYKDNFTNSTKIKNLKKKPFFKKKTKEEQQDELNKRLIENIFSVEKDKLFYFMLAYQNPQKVLIVKSPSGNKEQKQFLGYEWSGAKGSEGIKYKGGSTVNDIITPLFDPKNINNTEKINYLIQQNFIGKSKPPTDLENLSGLISYANVADILDFSRKDFNKAFSLTPKKSITIETKWELVKIKDFINVLESGNRPKGGVGNINDGVWSLGGEHIHATNGKVNLSTPKYVTFDFFDNSSRGILKENDILLCKDGALTGKVALLRKELFNKKAMINEHVFLIRCNDLTKQKYLFNFMFSEIGQTLLKLNITGAAQGGLNSTNLKELKIPLPPKEVQQQIVNDCEAIDKKVEQANQTIEKAKKEIEERVKDVFMKDFKKKKLENICSVKSGGTPSRKVSKYWTNGTIPWLRSEVCKEKIVKENIKYEQINELGLSKSSAKWLKEGTTLLALVGTTKGKTAFINFEATTNQNIAGIYSDDENLILNKFIFFILRGMYKDLIKDLSQYDMLNLTQIRNIKIPIPTLVEQKELVSVIEKLETKINKSVKIVNSSGSQKQGVMEKYL